MREDILKLKKQAFLALLFLFLINIAVLACEYFMSFRLGLLVPLNNDYREASIIASLKIPDYYAFTAFIFFLASVAFLYLNKIYGCYLYIVSLLLDSLLAHYFDSVDLLTPFERLIDSSTSFLIGVICALVFIDLKIIPKSAD